MSLKTKLDTKTSFNLNKVAKWLRLLTLISLLGLVTYESFMHQILGGGKSPSVHALCPLGGLESLYTLLFMGSYIQKIYSGTVVILVLTVVLALLFRRSFCGLLCPFGALQELFARLGIKLFKKRRVVPQVIDRPLRYLKYIILVLMVGMAWYYGTLWISPYDPYVAYGHITTIPEAIEEDPKAIIGFILLGITVVGSLIYDRFFCKYLCPAGALYGILGKFSPTKVVRNESLCINCKKCNKVCPVNIDVEKAVKVTDAECISCNECVLACPKEGALEVKVAHKVSHPLLTLAMVVGLFFGTVLVADATGNFQTIPAPLKEGEIIPVSEVKGYYTIEEAALATGLSLPELYEKLGIPEQVAKSTKMSEISQEAPEYDFDAAKEKAELEESSAVSEVSKEEPGVSNGDLQPEKAEADNNPNKIDVSGIKGSMTIREAAESLKMDLNEFYQLFKIPDGVPAQTQMKLIEEVSPGYSFSQIKEYLKQ
ncbi:MAG: 4Fe-4S binding protein [Desulfitobacterium sp.]